MPKAPVAAPEDRSNSPPIINRATATAMMPSVEATSRMDAVPGVSPNTSETDQKKAQMANAAMTAPISGLTRSLANTPR